jgi:hypothetical protein
MRTVYEFDGDLFATRAEAQAAFDARKKVGWGRSVGWQGTIREKKVFDSAQEWARYVGADFP